jgi:hypothetical protein
MKLDMLVRIEGFHLRERTARAAGTRSGCFRSQLRRISRRIRGHLSRGAYGVKPIAANQTERLTAGTETATGPEPPSGAFRKSRRRVISPVRSVARTSI